MASIVMTVKIPDTLAADALAEAVERKVTFDSLVVEALENLLDSDEGDDESDDGDSEDEDED